MLVQPELMLNSVMGKIYDILTNGDDTVPKSEDHFFSWCTPGMPVMPEDFDYLTQGLTGVVKKAKLDDITGEGQDEIDPAELERLRAQNTSQLYMQAEAASRMFNFVPDCEATTNDRFAALSIMNNEGSLVDRWEYILRMSQVMETVLPDETKAKIEKFRGLLTTTRTKINLIDDSEEEVIEPSALVNLYTQKMSAYEDAVLQYNTARIDALTADNVRAVHYWAMNANTLRNRVRAAMADWVANGYKHDYEGISAFIDQVMQRDMALLKQQYVDDLERARLTGLSSGNDFHFTSLVPANFMNSAGWTNFTFNSSDYARYSNSSYQMKSSRTSVGGGVLGFGGGGVRTGSASGETQRQVRFNSQKFSLNFSIAQAFIVRGNWFRPSFLHSKLWRFTPDNPEAAGEMVSDGGTPPKGLIPAYPTSVIFIKDLEISFKDSEGAAEAASEWERSSASGGGYFHFGPIHLGGSHARNSAEGERDSSFEYNSTSQSIKVPGHQIIGFKCQKHTEKMPDPLADITFAG